MANVKISDLTGAASASGTQEFEVNDSGTSKKVTGSQLATFIEGEVSSSPTLTGQVSLDNGTNTAPSLTNTGDTNTGLYFPSDDTVGLAAGGGLKLSANASGIDVTGTVTADGLTVDQGGTATLNLTSGASSWGMVAFGDPDDADVGRFFYDHGSNALTTRTAATNRMQIAGNGDISFYEDTGTTPKFFWDASAESLELTNSTGSSALKITKGNDFGSALEIINSGASRSLDINHNADGTGIVDDIVRIKNNGTSVFEIDSSGNVGIGTSSPINNSGYGGLTLNGANGSILSMKDSDTEVSRFVGSATETSIQYGTSSVLTFRDGLSGGSERMRIDSSGNVGIGTSSPATQDISANNLVVEDGAGNGGITIKTPSNAYGSLHFSDGTGADAYRGILAYNHSDNSMQFYTNTSEAMRIDSSGNLLVGKPATNYQTVGVEAKGNGSLWATADGNGPLVVTRKTSDGTLADFYKDTTKVGSIGTNSLSRPYIAGQSGVVFFTSALLPAASTGEQIDNNKDLGAATVRWDDIYATNGTIQTSDRNEKQDIEVLSEAETRVAVACKGLLRKFRWQDAVAEKGDDARIHFGIIAQDLQDAFAAEGLDAGRYAMFISSTWTDEETGEERTRMGVRYPELLAFIIAAI